MRAIDLRQHEFIQSALLDAVRIQKSLEDSTPVKVSPSYKRGPDEHEFYVLRVGHAIAELLTACDQISQTVAYLGSFANRPKLAAAGVTRHSHLLYHIENHLVRTHSLYDRSLLLVDAVFHLLNARQDCGHRVVLGNLKVARTSIPAKLKPIRKLLGKTIDARNDVIHHESYKEDALRELEMYCVYQSLPADSDESAVSATWVTRRIREMSRTVVSEKSKEFAKMDAALFAAIAELMTSLSTHYAKEKKFLELRVRNT